MPKIKDLGIKVIPETMRPLEAGGGAGCGASAQAGICPAFSHCFNCTIVATWCRYGSCWCSFRTPFEAQFQAQFQAQCPMQSVVCQVGTQGGGGCGPASPVCGGSIIDGTIVQQPVELTRESISALKEQLQQQIAKLDEHAKTLKK
jgi:hypothetical protein